MAKSGAIAVADDEKSAVVLNRPDNGKAVFPRIACSIVHAAPGRVRFRVPRLARDPKYAHRLQKLMESDKRVTGVRLNSAAASIAISYQTNLLSNAEMRGHLVRLIQEAGWGNREDAPNVATASLSGIENGKESSQLPPTKNHSSQESDWAELALPALATVVAVLGGPLRLPIPRAIIAGSVAAAGLPVAKRATESGSMKSG